MRRLCVNNEAFYQLGPSELPEHEMEGKLLRLLPGVFDDLYVVPFKVHVTSEDFGTAAADIALIDAAYRFWFVVEVELIEHSLFSHVLPQVRALRDARYSASVAEYLVNKSKDLDATKVRLMLKGQPPRVVVIANDFNKEWLRRLLLEDVGYLVATVYESRLGREAMHLSGDLRLLDHHVVSTVEFVKTMPKALRLTSPAALIGKWSDDLFIMLDGVATVWTHMETKNDVWIMSRGTNPLDPSKRYRIVQNVLGDLEFEREE